MDYYAWGMVKEAAPYIVACAALCILFWTLAPMALHWPRRKRKVDDAMRRWPANEDETP